MPKARTVYNNGACPWCFSEHMIKAGIAPTNKGKQQKYMCQDCRHITLYPIPQRSRELKPLVNEVK